MSSPPSSHKQFGSLREHTTTCVLLLKARDVVLYVSIGEGWHLWLEQVKRMSALCSCSRLVTMVVFPQREVGEVLDSGHNDKDF